jgi:glycosyltransferase involved in cell wall biosynthesis
MILNLMLGKKRGGIEQAVLDYAEALACANLPNHTVVATGSWAAQQCAARNIPYTELKQRSGWDLIAAWKLRRLLRDAGAVICHGNRALSLALLTHSRAKIIAVAHNYKTRRFQRADAVFAITHHAAETLQQAGMAAQRLHYMPNVAPAPATAPQRPAFRTPPIIGSMGRFVAKKGFELYLDALAIVKQRGVAFHAQLGGAGEEEANVRAHCTQLGLDDCVTFTGWVESKEAFFSGIDVFVLPSHHEPFGIVMAEAMGAALPFISTASEGPREVITHGQDGWLTPLGNATALADAIIACLQNPAQAQQMGVRAHQAVLQNYSVNALATRLKNALPTILTGN